jgi:hypothetical protein
MAHYIDSNGERQEITTCRVFRPLPQFKIDRKVYIGLSVNGGDFKRLYPINAGNPNRDKWERTRIRVEYNMIMNEMNIQVFN